jgi:hypothetical protein
VLATLARLPRLVLVLTVVGIMAGGLLVPGLVGALLLGLLAALTGWLAWLTWLDQPPHTRALRILVISALVAGAALKLW